MFNYKLFHKIYFSFLFIWLFGGIFTLSGSELEGSYKTPISLTGLIEPSETLQVQASIGGRVEAIHVKVNQTVAEDQLLLSIETLHKNGSWNYLGYSSRSTKTMSKLVKTVSRLMKTVSRIWKLI